MTSPTFTKPRIYRDDNECAPWVCRTLSAFAGKVYDAGRGETPAIAYSVWWKTYGKFLPRCQ